MAPNLRSQITYLFVKFGVQSVFLTSDMSKYGHLEVFQMVPSTSR